MKQPYCKTVIICIALLHMLAALAFAASPNLAPRKIEINRGYTDEAAKCIK